MNHTASFASWAVLSVCLPRSVAAQTDPAVADSVLELPACACASEPLTVLAGVVETPEGLPAEGVVVVSSAGGQCLTGAGGAFRLAVALPPDAGSVRVTAIQGSGATRAVASASVPILVLGGTVTSGVLTLARGGGCEPSWLPTFSGQPGVGNRVHAFATFDDGTGPALYAGGRFGTAGGIVANRVARWNGSSWSPLGLGMNAPVHALAVCDLGNGARLYAGGEFTSAGGAAANHIACWNGSSWSALGVGIADTVEALAAFDDGGGDELYAGGEFISAGGVTVNRIARWNGTGWAALGSGMSAPVLALTVCDLGGASMLYAGGSFTLAGGVAANCIARWDGASWSALGNGLSGEVNAIAAYDDGSGSGLVAGGKFLSIDAGTVNHIARWDGASWAPLGSGMNAQVTSLCVFDGGNGPGLYAGGRFETAGGNPALKIARWDGAAWSQLANGIDLYGWVLALAVHDEGDGPALFVGGAFAAVDPTESGMTNAMNIARWRDSSWSPLGNGLAYGPSGVAVFDDGSGPAVYTTDTALDEIHTLNHRIVRWDGTSWVPLGDVLSNLVHCMTVHDDGSGPALYIGGSFSGLVRRWDGTSWVLVGPGLGSFFQISSLVSFDDGSGPVLVAGGLIGSSNVLLWNGSSWSDISFGFNGASNVLGIHDDGSGPRLITADHQGRVARWNRPGWTQLGSSMNDAIEALASYDGGNGPALFAGGDFTMAGGAPANHVARWDGTSWGPVGDGINGRVVALQVYDDGTEAALYAGGFFQTAGAVAASRIAKWNGSNWSPLSSGVPGAVSALAVFDDGGGDGPSLLVGGDFAASPGGDSYIALWHSCADTLAPSIDCPEEVVVADSLSGPPGEVVHFTVTAIDGYDPTPSVVCVPPSGSVFPRGTTTVYCTATDAAGNQASCEFPVTVVPKARRR